MIDVKLFRLIPGHEGYMVSKGGVILSLKGTPKVLKERFNSSGYCRVVVMKDGKQTDLMNHIAVAKAYLKHTDTHRNVVYFKDGCKTNCHLSNLKIIKKT